MLVNDLRLAVRALIRRPGFTATALVTLAVALGANTAMFSVIHAVLLRPLPYPKPDRLVKIVGMERGATETSNLSPADFMDLARDTRTLAQTGAHGWVGFFTVADAGGAAERVGGVSVTAGFFPTLGAAFVVGRPFTAEEDEPNGPRVVILNHGFWQRRFGGDSAILGRTIDVNARPATVVGVLAGTFRHVEPNPEREADVFMPYQFETVNANRGGHFIRAVGRLRDDASLEDAQAELSAIAARLEQQYPESNTGQGVLVNGLHAALVQDARPALLVLAAAVVFVLIVASANLANLLLTDGVSRRAELAVRAAMGASRAQLVAQLVTESMVLALAGAAAGVGLALLGTRGVALLGASGVPRTEDIGLNPMVLAVALVLAVITGLVAGLIPALQVSRGDLHVAVREGGRGQARPALHRPLRELLIASQVALALVLLAGAALLGRTLWGLMNVETGFAADRAVSFEVAVPTATYAEGDQIPFYEHLYDRIRALPGVTGVGATNILPLSANYDSRGVQIDRHPRPIGQAHSIQARSVSPDYFRTMGIPLIRGRAFTSDDREGRPRVVIVSQSMAERYWPGADPIGQRLTFNAGVPPEEQQQVGGPGSREVIGIVGDVRHLDLAEDTVPMFYTPQAQQPSYHTMAVVVRTDADPAALTSSIRAELTAMDRGVPLYRVRTLESVVATTVAAPRLRAWLVGLFALVALALSAIGVYGVVSYLVGQRTPEIGIRLALGARGHEVVRSLLAEGLRPVALGLGAGVGLTLAGARLVSGLLFRIDAGDGPTLIAMASVLAAVAIVATVVPARRALRIDPAIALRGE